MNRAIDDPVHHDVRRLHFTIDTRLRRDDQGGGLVGDRGHIAAHHAVYAQPAAEDDVALNARGLPDEAVDAVLRFARFIEHFFAPFAASFRGSPCASRAAGSTRPRRHAPGHSRPSPWG